MGDVVDYFSIWCPKMGDNFGRRKNPEHNENMYDRASIENENETALILSESHFNQIQIMANHTHKFKLKIYKCQSINDRSTRKNIRTKCANIVVK